MKDKNLSVLGALNYIFSAREKMYLIYVLLLVLIGGALELIAVAVFTPFIEVFTNPDAVNTSSVLSILNDVFGFTGTSDFIVGIAGCIIVIYIVKNVFLTYEKNTVYKFSYGIQQRVSKRLIQAYFRKPYIFHLQTNPCCL